MLIGFAAFVMFSGAFLLSRRFQHLLPEDHRSTLLQQMQYSVVAITAANPVTPYYAGAARDGMGRLVNLRATIITASMVCAAFAVASAIALMTELDGAFTGLVTVSSAPLRDAIAVFAS